MLIKDNSLWYSGSSDREIATNHADPGRHHSHYFGGGEKAIVVTCGILAVGLLVLSVLHNPLWLFGVILTLAGAYHTHRSGKTAISRYVEVNQHLKVVDVKTPWQDSGAWGLMHRHLYKRYIDHYDIPPTQDYMWQPPRAHYWELVERHRDTINGFLGNEVVANGLQIVSDPDVASLTKTATEDALYEFAEKVASDIWAIESERQRHNRATAEVMGNYAVADLRLETANEPLALS